MTLYYTASREIPYMKHFRRHAHHCHLTVGATSNTYYNPKYCTFSVTSTPTHTLYSTGAQGLYAHSVYEI